MKYSPSEENYIKNIYHLQLPGQGVSATMLAATTHTKAASVTEMLKKLHRKKLINYKPYQNFTLTENGNRIALEIIRKHRLWEYFLVHKLGFQWDEVHEIADHGTTKSIGTRRFARISSIIRLNTKRLSRKPASATVASARQ